MSDETSKFPFDIFACESNKPALTSHAANSDLKHLPPAPFIPPRRVRQPNLLGASLTSNIVRASSARVLSSFNILLSTRASVPSNSRIGFGVLASSTKWLSQCGQYSSLSSNVSASFRKHFLHFLQAKTWRSA